MGNRIAFVLVFLLGVLPTGWAMEEAQDAPVTLEECRDRLASGDFVVTDGRNGHKPVPQVGQRLSRSVQEAIDDRRNGTPRFDKLRQEVLKRVIDGRWTISETSEDILDDCFFAVHPDAEVTE